MKKTKKNYPTWLFFLLFFVVPSLYPSPKAHSSEFHFLFYDPEWGFQSAVDAMERLSPFCDFLSETLRKDISPIYLKKETNLETYLKNSKVLFGILNTNVVFKQHDIFNIEPLLLPVKNGETTYQKVLIVPAHSKFNTISELKGTQIAILSSDRHTFQEQLFLITSENITPSHFFNSSVEAASHESAISSVIFNLTDSALTNLEMVKKKNSTLKDHIKILYPPIQMTYAPVVKIGKRIDNQETVRLQAALSSLQQTEKGKELMALIHADAFQKTSLNNFLRNLLFYEEHEKIEDEKIEDKKIEDKKEIEDKDVFYYKVKKGDTLWKIAQKFLGSGEKYSILAEINQIENPDIIFIDKQLTIAIPGKLTKE